MKYFKEVFFKEVSLGSEEDKKINALWIEALQHYENELFLIKERVSKKVWKAVSENSLHDLRFQKLEVEDSARGTHPLNITLVFAGKTNQTIYYKRVKTIKFSYIGDDSGIGFLGIHDCITSELLDVDGKLLSHEILFSSGATLYMEFEKIIIK